MVSRRRIPLLRHKHNRPIQHLAGPQQRRLAHPTDSLRRAKHARRPLPRRPTPPIRTRRTGQREANLYLLSLEDYTVKNLTQTDKIGYRDMRWSPDGKSLIFAAERESPGAYPIWQMDPG